MIKLTGRDYGSVKAVYKKTTDRKEHHHQWEYCKTPAFGRSGGGAGNENLQNVCKALYNYAQAAKTYPE